MIIRVWCIIVLCIIHVRIDGIIQNFIKGSRFFAQFSTNFGTRFVNIRKDSIKTRSKLCKKSSKTCKFYIKKRYKKLHVSDPSRSFLGRGCGSQITKTTYYAYWAKRSYIIHFSWFSMNILCVLIHFDVFLIFFLWILMRYEAGFDVFLIHFHI